MGRPRKPKQEAAEFYVAKEGFTASIDGAPVAIPAGEPIPAGHPYLKGREDLFVPWKTKFPLPDDDDEPEAEADETDDTEQATAAPGEKRNR